MEKKDFEKYIQANSNITVKDNTDCRFSIPDEFIKDIKNL